MNRAKGYTLVELVIAVGLFALVMTLASGAYLLMISINQQAQGIATSVNNLSFALETMARTIRTGTAYSCAGGGDCTGGHSFSVRNSSGTQITYALTASGANGVITQNGIALTDPVAVNVTSLTFYVTGTATGSSGEYTQPHVTLMVAGTVSIGPGKTRAFTVETGATMRGTDI
jgi:prepilin-type N-terminal cleavage/methylation domain-containing protein